MNLKKKVSLLNYSIVSNYTVHIVCSIYYIHYIYYTLLYTVIVNCYHTMNFIRSGSNSIPKL